jgi:DNA-binding LacI/PurR family transcriptional regulator
MSKQKRASSKEVAKEAGVSQATVSYVLNNAKGIRIKPETREAVLSAAKKLNYHPNLIARSMRLKKSMSIGVVSDKNVSNYIFMKVFEGVKDALISRNYSITLCMNRSQDIENMEHIKYFSSNRIDGIIFAYANLSNEHIAYLTDNGIPFVMVQGNMKDDVTHLVKTDMSNAISDAVHYLKEKGIYQISYFGTSAGNCADRRYNGYVKAIEHFGLPFDESILLKLPESEDEESEFLDAYFKKAECIPRAVICETANLGFRLLKYAAAKGIRIPTDMAVIAIGTSRFSNLSYPSLSAIEAPLYDMGVTGTGMLFDIIEDNAVSDVVVLEWTFIQRESS